ncbi:MAG: class I SAM-dependent methyltransferase [Candidatus Eremiobacteraeota bacterium]|nr:class I SAM-dependent methyltransferase [Candidatus Eremiobacteraeota bacterium]
MTTLGTGTSSVVTRCQICDGQDLRSLLFVGYLPPVNTMPAIGSQPKEETSYPADLLICPNCRLIQLGLVVDAQILFPASYPYTSSTTRILRENFAQLYEECVPLIGLGPDDLVVDIGSNDGNLLINFKDKHRICGITPEEIGKIAIERGIPTILSYFQEAVVDQILAEHGQAKLITATNVFAHIEKPHSVLDQVLRLLDDGGVFLTESHYVLSLIETVQYDTIYHEHLRYYSLHSLQHLLKMHGLEVFHVKPIPTHGGSIRVYAARQGTHPINDSVQAQLELEKTGLSDASLEIFRHQVQQSRLQLWALLAELRAENKRIIGVSAPSRASTLISYTGIDEGILEAVVEVKGSHKIGNYIPGTLIPVVDEGLMFADPQPDYALLLAWHIADELIPKLRQFGFKNKFIIPLPTPRVV